VKLYFTVGAPNMWTPEDFLYNVGLLGKGTGSSNASEPLYYYSYVSD